jgi:galactose mutarotase-like enzyme
METGFEIERAIRLEQGFEVYVLSNDRVEVAVVPELGAKVISLKNLRTGRDWMWHPAGGLKLFRNGVADDFSTSPLAGLDECLPTIAACAWQKRELADHGEVWSRRWSLHQAAWERGVLKTSIRLETSPFDFRREIALREDGIQFHYRLMNQSAAEELFLWAMHPLLRLRAGDGLVLPPSTRALLDGEAWVDALHSSVPRGRCSKLYAGPLTQGFAAIHNPKTGDRIDFEWTPSENNTLGLWLNCGGWHGHSHFAIEPTNTADDRLDYAAARKRCGRLAPAGTATWQVRLRLAP